MADSRVQMKCDGCGKTVSFPANQQGTVQECPECGGYIDVPEITDAPLGWAQMGEAYTRQSLQNQRQVGRVGAQQDETDRQLRRGDEQQEHFQRQLDRGDQQAEHNQRQLDFGDRLGALQEKLLERAGRLLDRWEALAGRLEQLLGDIEKRARG